MKKQKNKILKKLLTIYCFRWISKKFPDNVKIQKFFAYFELILLLFSFIFVISFFILLFIWIGKKYWYKRYIHKRKVYLLSRYREFLYFNPSFFRKLLYRAKLSMYLSIYLFLLFLFTIMIITILFEICFLFGYFTEQKRNTQKKQKDTVVVRYVPNTSINRKETNCYGNEV